MTHYWGDIAIAVNQRATAQGLPQAGIGGLIIVNESALTVKVSLDGLSTSKTLYPGTVDAFPIAEGFSGTVFFDARQVLVNFQSSPSTTLVIDTYSSGENISAYPLCLNRLSNIGNPLNMANSATAIQNDGKAAGTSIVEATQLNSTGSNVQINNDGTITIQEYVAGVLKAIFQVIPGAGNDVLLSAIGKTCEVLGQLVVDQNLVANGTIFPQNGITLQNTGKITLFAGSLSRMTSFSGTVGSAGALFNHGLGAVPDIVLIQETNTAGDLNTFTYDPASLTSTQVKVYGAGATPRNFSAVAFKF